MASTDEVIDKYKRIIESQLNSSSPINASKDYSTFKADMVPTVSSYERWAKSLGSIISLKVAEKDRAKIQKQLDIAHLNVKASESMALALMSMLGIFLGIILICTSIYLITGKLDNNLVLFGFLGLIASMFVFYYAYSMPARLANEWRLRASAQMVPAILYLVVYMKHTSNLERAIEFASEHLEGPLALDFKKIFYDVEIGKYSTIKQSIDIYLEGWRDYAPEFIESFHLIESSLYEPSEDRRIAILEKSLQVILDGIYEKMLKYSRGIRSPLTNVYMLGIILPTLGLALLPLASTLLGGLIQWTHVFIIFNLIVPFFVYYMTSEILLKRPGGYGESSILEMNPNYSKYSSNTPWIFAGILAFPLILIGILPFILPDSYTFGSLGINMFGLEDTKLFDFKTSAGHTSGPFGPGAILLSLFIPIGIGLFYSLTYKQKTLELIKSRENTKTLEQEFTNSLFQLGNRLGDGIPAEVAFNKVAESTQGEMTHDFFSLVSRNIQGSGFSLEKAIFDSRQGAIIYYPSNLIATSMRILVQSVKKGLQVAARSLISISDYVKNIEKINQRLRDLLAEVISDMKSNMVFLAPLLAGIVVGLSTMITIILNKLQNINSAGSSSNLGSLGSLASITDLFKVNEMIPPYFLQVSIGIYLIQITFILTKTLVTVDSGKDTLKEKYDISRNLKLGLTLYIITAFISISALTLLASVSMNGVGG